MIEIRRYVDTHPEVLISRQLNVISGSDSRIVALEIRLFSRPVPGSKVYYLTLKINVTIL